MLRRGLAFPKRGSSRFESAQSRSTGVHNLIVASELWREWSTSDKTGDRGLDGRSGTFDAVAWTEAEKEANPNRRGFIRVASNKHTLEYADGTSFVYTGNTWWSALTKIYAWGTDNCVSGISFQDAVALRKGQGFDGINMIACFPSDTQAGIWDKVTHGMKVAEDGSTPFKLDEGVDYTQINPKYWQHADRKMKHLWSQGFVPYLETVRRHEDWPNQTDAERKAFTNYVRYLSAQLGLVQHDL